MTPRHTYSVGKNYVHCYRDTAEEALASHREKGLDRRTGVYRWDARDPVPEDGVTCGRVISNPVRIN